MTTNDLLKHFSPATLAHLAAELIATHATPSNNGRGLAFATEDAWHAFSQIVVAGCDQIGVELFYPMIDEARAALAN